MYIYVLKLLITEQFIGIWLLTMFVPTSIRCLYKSTGGERILNHPQRHPLPLPHIFVPTKSMTVVVGVAINNDGVQQLVKTMERRLNRVTKERDKYRQMLENTKRALSRMCQFSSKLTGVTRKQIKRNHCRRWIRS